MKSYEYLLREKTASDAFNFGTKRASQYWLSELANEPLVMKPTNFVDLMVRGNLKKAEKSCITHCKWRRGLEDQNF
jgi:hypothetical protein